MQDHQRVRNDNHLDATATRRSPNYLRMVVAIAAVTIAFLAQMDDALANNEGQFLGAFSAESYLVHNQGRIAAGNSHACVLRSDGRVHCWGYNQYGQLGDGTQADRRTPVLVPALTNVVQIVAGGYHTCALTRNATGTSPGPMYCWGENDDGQLGIGSTSPYSVIPRQVTLPGDVIKISAGQDNTCAIVNTPTPVYCWGKGVGDGSTIHSSPWALPNVYGTPLGIALGYKNLAYDVTLSGCVWGSSGLYCWANGTVLSLQSFTVDYGFTLSDNGTHLCYTRPALQWRVECAGHNDYGQLGDGSTTDHSPPVLPVQTASGDLDAQQVSAGANHVCAVRYHNGGEVWCWGSGVSGQLGFTGASTCGQNSTSCSLVAGHVQGISGAIGIAAGSSFNCALLRNESVKCWGHNYWGQLGNGTNTDSQTPVTVIGTAPLLRVPRTFLGAGHACMWRGGLFCWGNNLAGQLGFGGSSAAGGFSPLSGCSLCPTPEQVTTLDGADVVSGGIEHTCALPGDGTAYCWGKNNVGQLGGGTVFDSDSPKLVDDPGTFWSVAAGGAHTCGLMVTGEVQCWGWNFHGQLGDGTLADQLSPSPIFFDSEEHFATGVATGYAHSCLLTKDGLVYCWGSNSDGQLGDGLSCGSSCDIPILVEGLDGVGAITAGLYFTCAALLEGTVKCWGDNSQGQLGDGTLIDRSSPVAVSGLGLVEDLDAGQAHVCVTPGDGRVLCWGDNGGGQLGDGTYVDSPAPTEVVDLGSAASVTAGALSSCATRSDSTVVCWGDNQWGQLGNGTFTGSAVPVNVHIDWDADGIIDANDNCPLDSNTTQLNADVGTGPFLWIKDDTLAAQGNTPGGDACDPDDDNNGCSDAKESLLGPPRNPTDPWDFADMWVPSLPPSGEIAGGRNGAITLADASAALSWVGRFNNGPPGGDGRDYDADVNENGVEDGAEYDRGPGSGPGLSGPPSGAVTLADVSVILAQIGDAC